MATAKDFFNALDKAKPIDYSNPQERKWYVENLRGDDEAVGMLAREIGFREGQGVYLFTGQIGSGKSTELLRLKDKLEKDGCSVFYSDLGQWLNPELPIELGSFLLAVVTSWVEQASAFPTTRTAAERFWDFLTRTNLTFESLKLDAKTPVASATLQMAMTQDASVIQQIEKTFQANKTNFVAQVHKFIEELVAEFPVGRKVVLLIDSLEKFHADKKVGETTLNSVLALFQNTHALKLPLVHVVYSISYLVYEQNRQLPAQLGNAFAVNLPSVHVFRHNSTVLDAEGVSRMLELVTKRFPAWEEFFTRDQVERAISNSAGDLRDFIRVLQVAIISQRTTGTGRIGDAAMDAAFNQIRPSLAIDSQHITWMVRLSTSHLAELDGALGIDFKVLNRYLTTKHVLAYLNGNTWYALHPLIRDEVLAMHDRIDARATSSGKAVK